MSSGLQIKKRCATFHPTSSVHEKFSRILDEASIRLCEALQHHYEVVFEFINNQLNSPTLEEMELKEKAPPAEILVHIDHMEATTRIVDRTCARKKSIHDKTLDHIYLYKQLKTKPKPPTLSPPQTQIPTSHKKSDRQTPTPHNTLTGRPHPPVTKPLTGRSHLTPLPATRPLTGRPYLPVTRPLIGRPHVTPPTVTTPLTGDHTSTLPNHT